MKSDKLYILGTEKRKLLKMYIKILRTQNRMTTISMNSEIKTISDPH